MEVMKTHNETNQSTMRLYNRANRRLYLNASERARFLVSCQSQPPHICCFALTLFYTGCRLSEARELTVHSVQSAEQLIAIRSLKKRSQHHVREVPVPTSLINALKCHVPKGDLLWPINRITAYRWIKAIMEDAGITGSQASPKGLRHSYGIHAIGSGVQLHMLQKWMGHASIKTTAIYANAVGSEERRIAERMW